MAFCMRCGAKAPEGSKYCLECGAEIVAPVLQQPQAQPQQPAAPQPQMQQQQQQVVVPQPHYQQPQYKYDAFISYRHTEPDRTIAVKLQEMLEKYKAPQEIAARIGEKKLHFFRDEDELPTSSNLSAGIDEALEQSRYLICICSPEYLESRWCMQEITQFKIMHGGSNANIIPLVVKGDDPTKVFPVQLTHETRYFTDALGVTRSHEVPIEPLAGNVAAPTVKESLKKLKTEALRIAAPLLGVGYNDLYDRDARRAARTRRNIFLAAFAAMAFITVSATVALVNIYRQSQEIKRGSVENLKNSAQMAYDAGNPTKAAEDAAASLLLQKDLREKADPETEAVLAEAAGIYSAGETVDVSMLHTYSGTVSPAYNEDGTAIVVVDETGDTCVLDAVTGKERFRVRQHTMDGYVEYYPFNHYYYSSYVAGGGMLIVTEPGNNPDAPYLTQTIKGYDMEDGAECWNYQNKDLMYKPHMITEEGADLVAVWYIAIMDDNWVDWYGINQDNSEAKLLILERETGFVRAEVALDDSYKEPSVAGVPRALMGDDGTVVFVCPHLASSDDEQMMYEVLTVSPDGRTGGDIVTIPAQKSFSEAVEDGRLYVYSSAYLANGADREGALTCIDLGTFRVLWSAPFYQVRTQPMHYGNYDHETGYQPILISVHEGKILLIDFEQYAVFDKNGKPLANADMEDKTKTGGIHFSAVGDTAYRICETEDGWLVYGDNQIGIIFYDSPEESPEWNGTLRVISGENRQLVCFDEERYLVQTERDRFFRHTGFPPVNMQAVSNEVLRYLPEQKKTSVSGNRIAFVDSNPEEGGMAYDPVIYVMDAEEKETVLSFETELYHPGCILTEDGNLMVYAAVMDPDDYTWYTACFLYNMDGEELDRIDLSGSSLYAAQDMEDADEVIYEAKDADCLVTQKGIVYAKKDRLYREEADGFRVIAYAQGADGVWAASIKEEDKYECLVYGTGRDINSFQYATEDGDLFERESRRTEQSQYGAVVQYNRLTKVAVSPEGRFVACADEADGRVYLYDTGKDVMTEIVHGLYSAPDAMRFAGEDDLLLLWENGTLRRYGTNDGAQRDACTVSSGQGVDEMYVNESAVLLEAVSDGEVIVFINGICSVVDTKTMKVRAVIPDYLCYHAGTRSIFSTPGNSSGAYTLYAGKYLNTDELIEMAQLFLKQME